MSNCVAPGWGTGPYGMTPWGGGLGAIAGGPLPTQGIFDIYCVGPCGPMSFITTYDGVGEDGDPLQFEVVPSTLDMRLGSGGTFSPYDARLTISTTVPELFTLDFTVSFTKLPTNFNDIVFRHIFVGISDAAGFCAGLFFSKIGFAYTGSIHHTGGTVANQNLVLDNVLQPLPNSQTLISEGEYYSFRIAVDGVTGTTYIFVTKTSDLPLFGYQLQYVLPGFPSSSCAQVPPDRTLLSVRGTVAEASILDLDSICLGSGLIVPNLPPIADAGVDQASRACEIIQLDGSRSHDPEGAPIVYQWRLIDAPTGSQFIFDGLDGTTFSLGSGFTNKLYSAALSVLDVSDPIIVGSDGDVFVVQGKPYTIIAKGSDGHGFFVQTFDFAIPDTLSNAAFKLLRQRGLSGPTSVKPTFYPDLPGFWKFDLIVNDGALSSDPSVTIVIVSESPQPRGCIPDVSFIWNYLSDFWSLIDDRQHLEVFWSALAQIAASELLSLWQVDYGKSLRDIQRTFQRRWLHYDTVVQEPFPDTATLRAVLGGVGQIFPLAGLSGIPGTTLTFTIPVIGKSATITFTGGGTLTAQQVADQLTPFLRNFDTRFQVRVIANRVPPAVAAEQLLRVDAPFTFSIAVASTAPIFISGVNGLPAGSGAGVGIRTYQVDRSLQYLDLQATDLLQLDGLCYRIIRVLDDPGDEWPYQRLILSDDLPTTPSTSWSVVGKIKSQFVDFYNALVWKNDLVTFEVFEIDTKTDTHLTIAGVYVVASEPTALGIDLTSIANYMLLTDQFEVLYRSFQRLNYLPLDSLVVDIPYLQAQIKSTDDKAILRRNIDFFIEPYRGTNALRFAFDSFGGSSDIWQDPTTVPAKLWAEVTYLDNRPMIEGNFGIPAEFTLDDLAQLPSNTDYLSTVRGLWYAYFNGPTLFNMRVGTQILLGLPFAEEAGTISEIRADFSPTQGRILITDLVNTSIVRSYTYPLPLDIELNPATDQPYVVGDVVAQFAPLVTGVTVTDYVKDPKWFQGYLNQGAFFEVEKFFKFMVRVDSPAFSLPTLLFVKSFILRIKPTYAYPLFIVLRKIKDTEISTTDVIKYSGTLYLFDGACTNDSIMGLSTMWDEPRPAGGGWRSQYDGDNDPATVPVYPNAEHVFWGFDKGLLCPEDYIDARVCVAWPGGTPTFDSLFAWDTEIYNAGAYGFGKHWVTFVSNSAGLILDDNPTTVTANAVLMDMNLMIVGDPGASAATYNFTLYKNGILVSTIPFTMAGPEFMLHSVLAIAVNIGDTLEVRIDPSGGGDRHPFWKTVSVELGQAAMWAYDTNLGAASYCVYRAL